MLKSIGMIWISENIDKKLQNEIINDENINRKQAEIYNRFLEYLSSFESNEFLSRNEFNDKFIDQLNSSSRKK